MDFGGLKELKAFLQDQFDHKLVIASNDPELKTFQDLEKKGVAELTVLECGVGIEKFAEYVCKAAHSFVQHKTNNRVECTQAEVFEHAENSAIYSRENAQTISLSDEVAEKDFTEAPTEAPAKKEKVQKHVPKETNEPPKAVPVGGKNKPSTWDFGTTWA